MQAMFKPLDGLLLAVILVIAVFWSQCDRELNTEPHSLRIVTEVSDDTVNLFTDTLITMQHVTIEIVGGRGAITQSDCPTKQCVHTGWIGSSGQISACMPNGVWIEILGAERTTDVISY